MSWSLKESKRGVKCSICATTVVKGDKYFGLKKWVEGQVRPVTSNSCLKCAKQITSDDFVEFITGLLDDIQELKGRISQ